MKGWISPCVRLLWITWLVPDKPKPARQSWQRLDEGHCQHNTAHGATAAADPQALPGRAWRLVVVPPWHTFGWVYFSPMHTASPTVPGRLCELWAGLFLHLADNVFVSGIWLTALVNVCNLFKLLVQMILKKEIPYVVNECRNGELDKWQHWAVRLW